MTYTQYGPWTDGGSPGVSAEFLNPLETFLLTLNNAVVDSHLSANGSGVLTATGLIVNGTQQPNPTASTLSGSTSGTANIYQYWTGTLKQCLIYLNNFRNGGGSNQTMALSTAFTTIAYGRSSDAPSMSLTSSGSAQSLDIVTSLSTAGGAHSSQTFFGSYTLFQCAHAFDTVLFTSGQATAHTGLIILEGI